MSSDAGTRGADWAGRGPWYDTAQICLNRHVITERLTTNPESQEKYCHMCGAPTISTCQSCGAPINGYRYMPRVRYLGPSYYTPPAFCSNCGEPYPWTVAARNVAEEYIQELEHLNDREKERLSQSLDDIIRATPRTKLAATRFKTLLSKAGSPAAEILTAVLKEIAVSEAKKDLFGG